MGHSIPVIFHPGAIQPGDTDSYGQAPIQSEAGLGVVRDPLAGSAIALCALPGMFTATGAAKTGYLTLQKRTAGVVGAVATSKIRLITTDHPDGG